MGIRGVVSLLQRYILTKCRHLDNLFNDMEKFVVRLGGNGARDPQFSNADCRPIAQKALEKPYLLR